MMLEYLDEYRLTDDGWKVTATHFNAMTTMVLKLDEDALKKVYVGRKPQVP